MTQDQGGHLEQELKKLKLIIFACEYICFSLRKDYNVPTLFSISRSALAFNSF
jgi:hypothetical protein